MDNKLFPSFSSIWHLLFSENFYNATNYSYSR